MRPAGTACRPRIAVIGGGIAGLVAVHRLLASETPVEVLLVEASRRLGGKILSGSIGDDPQVPVERGPDGFVASGAELLDVCTELGLGDDLVRSRPGAVQLWTRDRLRRLPSGLAMGLPTSPWGVLRSGVLSPTETLRAGLDLVLPRKRVPHDVTLAALVAPRMGDAVVERLVEPLVGGVYAGSARTLGADASLPGLRERLQRGRSITRALRSRGGGTGGGLLTLRGGLGSLVDALAAEACARGVDIRLGSAVTGVHRHPSGRVEVCFDNGVPETADAVVVAVPAAAAAALLRPVSRVAAADLELIPYASVAVVSLLYDAATIAVPPASNGFLVPPVEGRLLRACTWTTVKWPHAAREGLLLARCSVGSHGDRRPGELDDTQLVRSVHGELQAATGLTGRPLATQVTRWADAIPQHLPGHRSKVERIRESLPTGVLLAGAAYDGVGIASCAAQGARAAAGALVHALSRGPLLASPPAESTAVGA